METILKVFSIIGIVLGAMAILQGFAATAEDGVYAIMGGGLFLAQGVFALAYIKEVKDKKEL